MQKTSIVYKIIIALLKFFYVRPDFINLKKIPDEPCIIVANHCQMNGPIISEVFLPINHYTWCASEMMHIKEVPAYAFKDFWSEKPTYIRWFFKLASYVIAPISAAAFSRAKCIEVYHDIRIQKTFKDTLRRLEEGYSIVIFPEHGEPYNHILCDFQDKFINLAQNYYKRTGKKLQFVPMYNAPHIDQVHIGDATTYDPERPMEEERARIKTYLMEGTTQLAEELPKHMVVPYRQTPKHLCPSNKSSEPYGPIRVPMVDYTKLQHFYLK